MTTPPFVHLHCHSHYSLLDGASPIDKMVARAQELGMNGLAITDHGNLYGALEFYKRALGAREVMRMAAPGGKIGHAEIRIGDSFIMLSDEFPGTSTKAPTSLGGTTGSLMVYLPNVDVAFKKAIDAGCKSIMAPADMFWGDRLGKLEDPYGNQWALATHKEDVPPKQMAERAKAAMAAMAQGQGNA